MRELKIGPGGREGGRLPVAYSIDSGMPACINMWPGQFLRTHFDCEGKLISAYHTWKCLLETETGQEMVLLCGYGGVASEKYAGEGKITDIRSLAATAAGCCPPALTSKMLGEDVDVVAEAIKLHKRGYFGGGG